MGQKTNPIGLRLGINRIWDSIWFDEKNYAEKLEFVDQLKTQVNTDFKTLASDILKEFNRIGLESAPIK